jgi:hypothetical protein
LAILARSGYTQLLISVVGTQVRPILERQRPGAPGLSAAFLGSSVARPPRNYDWKADGVLGTLTINGPGVERMPKKRKIPPRQDGIAGR